jgi:nucleotide-binding universal stress UspA family protein
MPARTSSSLLEPFDPVMPPHGPILVASDTSPASDAAFPMARVLAAHTGAAVQVISALRASAIPTYAFEAVSHPVVPTPDQLDARAQLVRQQVAMLEPGSGASGAPPWPVQVRVGDPVREIVGQAHATEARLIVVGRGRHGMLERLLGGETVLRLLQLGDTPVLAVDAHLESLPRRVIIATDFSVFSVYAAQVALDFVAPDATVALVHVAPSLSDTGPAQQEFSSEYRQQVSASFLTLIEQLQRPGLTFETRLLEGNVSTQLAGDVAEFGASLVVSATHGYGFLRRMMLGSVAAELVRSAPCSVLCVPGSAHTLAAARAQATALHDHTHLLDMETLDQALFTFSVRHAGRACTVEVVNREAGAHSIGHHLRLAGVSYERAERTATLMFGTSVGEGQHLSHQVPDCRQVELVVDGHERDQLLRFTHARGQTLVLLE